MKTTQRFASAMLLLPCLWGSSLVAANPLELPDQYAEVVLRVEGMI